VETAVGDSVGEYDGAAVSTVISPTTPAPPEDPTVTPLGSVGLKANTVVLASFSYIIVP
jgi:hypothetical protein